MVSHHWNLCRVGKVHSASGVPSKTEVTMMKLLHAFTVDLHAEGG